MNIMPGRLSPTFARIPNNRVGCRRLIEAAHAHASAKHLDAQEPGIVVRRLLEELAG
jgi:hypothetical protein